MATMGRSGRGRARRAPEAVGAEATAAGEEPMVDIVAKEAALAEEFAREFEFRDAESDYASRGFEVRAAGTTFSFAQLKEEYAELWAEMAIRRERLAEADRIVQRIIANKERYRTVEASTAVPWYVIAVIHSLEGSSNFRTHLHNGDPLTARTVHVPAGRPRNGQPPFSWEESAMDALAYDGMTQNTDWSIEHIAYVLEGFNGWGYRRLHPDVKSPYLWSFSNHYTRGKYVADGKWSPTAVSDQCGAMVLLRRLEDLGAIRTQRSAAPAAFEGQRTFAAAAALAV
jgi:lysozyme family protein